MKSDRALLDEAAELARTGSWSEEVCRDLMAVQSGKLEPSAFDAKYLVTQAILVLDFTGFTEMALRGGALASLLRILDGQRTYVPVLRDHGATFIRTFADDIVALFDEPLAAVDAALEIQDRSSERLREDPDRAACCIGIGFGRVYAIGPNHAMGDEMNRASKLGEDTARGGEILVTERVRDALPRQIELHIAKIENDDLLFPYFQVERAGNALETD